MTKNVGQIYLVLFLNELICRTAFKVLNGKLEQMWNWSTVDLIWHFIIIWCRTTQLVCSTHQKNCQIQIWHKTSFTNSNKKFSTELSKHISHLKDNKSKFKVTWQILKQATPYNPASNRCNLCLWEKYFIICRPELASLNKQCTDNFM